MKFISALAGASVALLLGLSAFGVQEGQATEAAAATTGTADEAAMIAEQMPTYPMTTCVISGEELGGEMGDPIDFLHEGRLVRLCCKGCVKKFKKDPAKHMAMVDAAIIKEQMPNYPLTTCPISGNEFGEEHPGINVIHGTRLVRFCCEDCVKSYKKNPAKAMAALDAAYIAAQLPDYKPTTCPVSGEELGGMGDPVNLLYGNTLVRLCCKGCVKKFKKEPAMFMEKLGA